MTDGQENQKDALVPEKEGQPRSDEQNPSVKTYQQSEVDQLLKERHRGLNKQIDALTKERDLIVKERDTLKTKVTEAETSATRATETVKDLEKDLETAIAGDADQADILKLKRELRTAVAAERVAIEKERTAFEAERKSHDDEWKSKSEMIKKSEQLEWDGIVFEVAKVVEGDARSLREAAAELGIEKKESLEVLAKRLYPTKPLIDGQPMSLDTKGGTNALPETASARERITKGLKELK